MLGDTSNQPFRVRTRNWVEMNDKSRETYNNNQIRIKNSMLRSSLCDYSDKYILFSKTIKIAGTGADDAARRLDERNKGVIFKNCAPFNDRISGINNTNIDHARDLDLVMPMYNFIEYSEKEH